MIHPKQHYLDLFQVGESQLDTLIAEACGTAETTVTSSSRIRPTET